MKVVIIIIETLRIVFMYEADSPNQSSYGGEWGSPQVTVHMEVPEGLDHQCIMAVRADDGTITLIADPQRVEAKTQAAWTALRAQRNSLLAACDWTQLPDSALSQDKKVAWGAYRQALRNLTDTVTDPTQVDWPLAP